MDSPSSPPDPTSPRHPGNSSNPTPTPPSESGREAPEVASAPAAGPISADLFAPAAKRSRWDDLQKQYQFLETMFALAISALILLRLGLNLFLFKQGRLARGQIAQQGELIRRASKEFHRTREPTIREFIKTLQGYAASDPEFRTILEKYRPYLGQYFTETPAQK